MTGLRLDLHRAEIDSLFARGVREATVRKSSNPGNDQNDSSDFHRASGYTTICTMGTLGAGREATDVEPSKIPSCARGVGDGEQLAVSGTPTRRIIEV